MIRFLRALLGLCLFASPALAGDSLPAPEALTLAQAGKVMLIDVRTPQEWQETGIASHAVTAQFTNPSGPQAFVAEIMQVTKGNKAAPVALICRSGNRSARAAALLRENGFTNVSDIGEGMSGWLKRGLPVTAWGK